MEIHYAQAQVCLNGHQITGDTRDGDGANFCPDCGEPTVSRCCHCDHPIRGDSFEVEGGYRFPSEKVPAFCYFCGTPHQWTRRAVEAAKELADEIEGIDDDEREKAKASFISLASDSPQTTIAATRVGKLIAKAGPVVGDGIRDLVVSIATDAAKKAMGL